MDRKEGEGMYSLNKYTKVENLKEVGGWGLKNIPIFSLALAAIFLLRLVYNEGFLGKVMKYKYLKRVSMECWFKKERKISQRGSIVWKSLVRDFPLIGK